VSRDIDQELSSFLSTFWSSQVQDEVKQKILDKETYDSIYNLIAASIIRNTYETRA
jgi:predicted membrane channel-forming protein YqfA (hemolysin III family)